MKLVSLNISNTKIGVSLFDGILLKNYNVILLNEYILERHLNEIYTKLEQVIKETKCDIVVMKMIDLSKNGKDKLFIEGQVRGVIKLLCERNGVIYQEFKTEGYFKKLTSGKNTLTKKVSLLKKNNINIVIDKNNDLNDTTILVDSILLGEGVAMGKLQISE